MADQKPWERYAAPAGIVVKDADPRRAYEGPLAAADLQAKAALLKKTQLETEALRRKMADDQGGADTLGLSKPAIVQALIDGRMAPPSGAALKSPYWQGILGEVATKDPSFDLVNYGARAATRKDFTSGKSSANIKALNTALGHLGELYGQISGTARGGGDKGINPLAQTFNALGNAYERGRGASGITKYTQTAGALAGELTQVYRQSGGAEADIQRYISELDPNASEDQKRGAVANMAKLLKSRLDAINDQYVKGMGTTAQPLQILDPHAQKVLATVSPDDDSKTPPMGGLLPGGGNGTGSPPIAGGGSSPFTPPTGSGGAGIATGSTRTEFNAANSALIDRMIRSGASASEIDAALPRGSTPTNPAKVKEARDYLRSHPGFKGSFGEATQDVPTTAFQQIAAGPVGAAAGGFFNGATAGFSDEIAGGLSALTGGDYTKARDTFDLGKKLQAAQNPISSTLGNIAGTGLTFAAPEFALGRLGMAGKAGGIIAPRALAADAGLSALYGAGENNQDRLGGAIVGGALGAVGGVAGRTVGAGLGMFGRSRAGQAIGQKFGDLTGRGFTPPPSALTGAESAAYGAANKAGIPGIQAQLAEAQRLGVPMSLADTTPELTSLAGAAVRRSPTAAQMAESVYQPRALGQVDRFGQAINRDLGPTANVPQLSQDLMTQAKTAAGPLYDKAYAQPVISTPELDSLLNTPFGREGLGKARTIIANERGSPTELGISQDASGNAILNPQPGAAISRSLMARSELDAAQNAYRLDRSPASIARVEKARDELRQAQTAVSMSPDPNAVASVPGYNTKALDYVKRGMDDVLEQSRDQFGRLNLTGALKAQNDVKTSLLSEMDRLNPHYRDARAAYAGPMQSRDALTLGGDATKMDPQELALGLMGKSPEQLDQVRLGYRSGLTGQADAMRYNRNPFDAILGTPDAESRLAAVYPNNPGNANLLRQRDLEAQLARTNTAVTGGSQTAGRSVADRAFDLAAAPTLALDAGMITMGHAPLATAALLGAKGLKTAAQRYGQRLSVSKADDLAPLLLNTDPAASGMTLSSIGARQQAYFDAVLAQRRRIQQPAGMFGAALTSQGAR